MQHFVLNEVGVCCTNDTKLPKPWEPPRLYSLHPEANLLVQPIGQQGVCALLSEMQAVIHIVSMACCRLRVEVDGEVQSCTGRLMAKGYRKRFHI